MTSTATLPKSATALRAYGERNGWTCHDTVEWSYEQPGTKARDARTIPMLGVPFARDGLKVVAVYKDGGFTHSITNNLLVGTMNMADTRAALDGSWQDRPRCATCQRWAGGACPQCVKMHAEHESDIGEFIDDRDARPDGPWYLGGNE